MITENSIFFIINPISGGSNKSTLSRLIEDFFAPLHWKVKIEFTTHSGHAIELTQQAIQEKYEIVCAVGGDGTINQVATGLIGSKTKLAIIPKGSGNGIANHLHIPKNEINALELIVKKHASIVDIGKCNQDYFLCTCGFGFDAKIALSFSQLKTRGLKSYIKSVLQNFRQYTPINYTISTENLKLNQTLFILSVANAAQYGNHTIIAPKASIRDGFLDLCSIKKPNFLQLFELGICMLFQKIDASSTYETHKIQACTITSDEDFFIHIDGEPVIPSKKVELKIIPKALEIIHLENCFI